MLRARRPVSTGFGWRTSEKGNDGPVLETAWGVYSHFEVAAYPYIIVLQFLGSGSRYARNLEVAKGLPADLLVEGCASGSPVTHFHILTLEPARAVWALVLFCTALVKQSRRPRLSFNLGHSGAWTERRKSILEIRWERRYAAHPAARPRVHERKLMCVQ